MGRHIVFATIYDKKGRVLSKATNDYTRSHPMQARFAREAGMPARIYLHAELSALIKLKRNDRPSRISIERYTKDGQPALAAPCPVCQAAIKFYGINRVEYTL